MEKPVIEKRINKKVKVIPGFGLTSGITLTMLSLIVIIPLFSILGYSFRLTFVEFKELIFTPNVIAAFIVSISCSLLAATINSVFGLILAWVLVRYSFYGKRFLEGLIELPFALPTAVAGITLSKMYSDQGIPGKYFAHFGISISYTKIGLIIALIFVGIPFVVRTLQPVLEGLEYEFEEAAEMLGASRFQIFWKVIFPEIRPALFIGFGLALARGIGEYGSVIYISGNSQKNKTQVVSYLIMQKLNSGDMDYSAAAAIALVLLIISFVMLFVINIIQINASKRTQA